jgi:hypothetical protein
MPATTANRNGRSLTLVALAEAKHLPANFLGELGLHDLPQGGVGVPYYGPTGEELAVKRRTAPKATEGSYWPKGKPLAAYGQWRLDAAEKAGFLVLVEGESDCWALWHHGLPALGLPGADTAKTLLHEHVEAVGNVYVHREPDAGGERFVEGVCRRLAQLGFAGKVYELRMPDGVKDPADLHARDPEGLKAALEGAISASALLELRQQAGRGSEAGPWQAKPRDGRPTITITTDEHLVNDEAVAALTGDPDLYQRGGLLVRIVRDTSPAAKGGVRRPLAPRIDPLPAPLLRERLAANSRWATAEDKPARPPAWCVSAVHARAGWAGVRHLEAVVDYPVLRPDGTVLAAPGYDADTGLLLEPAGPVPDVPSHPTRDQARAASNLLLEVVADFPFAQDVHRAAWLAALLTPLARFAFTGPSPLFLVDSNVRGAGKGLLLDCISRIVTGERFTVAVYTGDEDELRKRITSLALAGDRLVLFDNLEGKFGNAVLDAALTGTTWKDRVLGVNRMAEAPLYMTWYATGNNVAVAADTARRICHCRLESPEERPEERCGFRHPDLLAWVGEGRGRLLVAALTVLRAYCAASRPDLGLPAWGSFEGWSRLVRSAVVWVGLTDPGETRLLLQESADVAAECMAVLLGCWERMDPDRHGMTAAEVIHLLYKKPPSPAPDYHADMKDALEALLGRPDARGLGTKLRSYRRRVFGGLFFDQAGTHSRAIRWAVYPAKAFLRRPEHARNTGPDGPAVGECGECGECVPPQAEIDLEGDGHGDAWEPPADGQASERGNRPAAGTHSPHSPHSPGAAASAAAKQGGLFSGSTGPYGWGA